MQATRLAAPLHKVSALGLATLAALALAAARPAAAQAPQYAITALPIEGDGINAHGDVISRQDPNTGLDIGGTVTTVQNLYLGDHGYSAGLNDAGQAVGQTFFGTVPGQLRHASLYSDGVITDLGTLGRNTAQSYAEAINNVGQVTGGSQVAGGGSHAFLYTLAPDGTVARRQDLGTLGAGTVSEGDDVNDAGQVVGSSATDPGGFTFHAFLYSDGVMTDLGASLPGSSGAYAVNEAGHAVGEGFYDVAGEVGFQALLFENGTVTQLYPGTPGFSSAFDINDSDDSVGQIFIPNGTPDNTNAALWLGTHYYDLNTLIAPDSGWLLASATGINDAGQITGYGKFNGQYMGFLLSPLAAAPEPSPAAALGLGVLGLGGLALRRRREQAESGGHGRR